MPRGRHRQSPPLHKLLPPLSIAAASIACAAGALVVGETAVVRGLAVAASAAAVVGAFLMRGWDRAAGKRVAELTKARTADEWRTEERIAELEADAEEAREIRDALNTKLRAKRAELARLRNEHAALLRRYATAETERARALEGRRAALDTTDATDAADATPGQVESGEVRAPAGADAESSAATTSSGAGQASVPGARLDAETFRRAAAALRRLSGEGADADAADPAQEQDSRATVVEADSPAAVAEPAAASGAEGTERTERAERPGLPGPRAGGDTPQVGGREAPVHLRNAASAVVPYAAARRAAARAEGTFDFFGTRKQPQLDTRQQPAAAEEDLADVVGAEALAEQAKRSESGEVIDLTAHDETEQIDVAELRSAIS